MAYIYIYRFWHSLSEMFSGICSDILPDILSGIYADILSGMCSGAGNMVFGSRRAPEHPDEAEEWQPCENLHRNAETHMENRLFLASIYTARGHQ